MLSSKSKNSELSKVLGKLKTLFDSSKISPIINSIDFTTIETLSDNVIQNLVILSSVIGNSSDLFLGPFKHFCITPKTIPVLCIPP